MPKHVRVENNEVVECVDVMETLPDTGDWRYAIEIVPQVTPSRQIRGQHYFDITKSPVEIWWEVINLSVEERKTQILNEIEGRTREQIQDILNSGVEEIDASQQIVEKLLTKHSKKTTVEAFTTHEEIDTYIQNNP